MFPGSGTGREHYARGPHRALSHQVVLVRLVASGINATPTRSRGRRRSRSRSTHTLRTLAAVTGRPESSRRRRRPAPRLPLRPGRAQEQDPARLCPSGDKAAARRRRRTSLTLGHRRSAAGVDPERLLLDQSDRALRAHGCDPLVAKPMAGRLLRAMIAFRANAIVAGRDQVVESRLGIGRQQSNAQLARSVTCLRKCPAGTR